MENEEEVFRNGTSQDEPNSIPDEETETRLDIYRRKNNPGAVPSVILGIIGSLAWLMPIIGLPITIVGMILGAMGMKRETSNRAFSIAGFVMNLCFMVAAIAKGIVDLVFYFKKSKRV